MELERIEKHINLTSLREEIRKVGVNFITAGVVGVFIDHFVGTKFSSMFWASLWITFMGSICLFLGVVRRNKE
jgi:hypothetical protein